jgi:putative flippase GtrA
MELTRFFRYVITGLVANGLGLAIFQAFIWAGLPPEAASFLTSFPSVLAAYLMNKLWSFESSLPHGKVFVRYILVTIAMIALQVAIVSVFYRLFGVWPLGSALIAIALATPVSFVLMNFWVFADDHKGESGR